MTGILAVGLASVVLGPLLAGATLLYCVWDQSRVHSPHAAKEGFSVHYFVQ
ncbi:MAG: hypothetical protein QNK37_02965 [Acidobacteriota bacterium]|nr:hypothetical protein [Acidobacteriota bacterium]